MVRRLIIHIGMPKAGSSTIQYALRSKREELSRSGLYYLRLGECHNEVFRTFCGAVHPRKDIPQSTAVELGALPRTESAYAARMSEEARKIGDVGVVSAEALIYFDLEKIEKIKNFFDQYVDEYRVLAYLREPIAWANSRIQQIVKNDTGTLDGVLGTIGDPDSPLTVPYRRLRDWESVFGRPSLVLRPFGREFFIEGDLISDFCLSIERPDIEGILPREDKNLSLSFEAVEMIEGLKRLEQKRGGPRSEASRRLRSAVLRMRGERFSLPRDVLDRVQGFARPDVEWLKETYGIDLQPDGPRFPNTPVPWRRETIDDLTERLERALTDRNVGRNPIAWLRSRFRLPGL